MFPTLSIFEKRGETSIKGEYMENRNREKGGIKEVITKVG